MFIKKFMFPYMKSETATKKAVACVPPQETHLNGSHDTLISFSKYFTEKLILKGEHF